ncbi:unnamed protein product [Ambrosiozyma monospora]|uniref:Unnamed protein product n=1 Tax=Ambrosiozyma monospora TaxID=43982 RepID=A0A9W6Z2N4_AMBMO|nr:unnamed protein product [Ambrosiozyma monospora]
MLIFNKVTLQFEEPLRTTTTYSSSISNVVEGNLFKVVSNTDDAEVVKVYATPSSSNIVSSAISVASPSVTPYTNTLAMEWATVMVMESILGQPSLYILPGDNSQLTSVWGSYQNYSSSITYHPGYKFLLNDTEKVELLELYQLLYSLFDTDVFNHITKLIDIRYSEFDSLTLPVTLPSGAPTGLNASADSMLSIYYSMALGNALFYDMETSFEQRYRAVLNTHNDTNLMRRAYDAYTSRHNQQFDDNPVSIWSVQDEFISVLPWGSVLRNIGYSSHKPIISD